MARTGNIGRLLSVLATISFSRTLLHSSHLVRPSYILLPQEHVRPGIFKNLALQKPKMFQEYEISMAPHNINGTRSAPKIFNSEGGEGRADPEAVCNSYLILKIILQKSCHKYKCNITLFVNTQTHTRTHTHTHTYIYIYTYIHTYKYNYIVHVSLT